MAEGGITERELERGLERGLAVGVAGEPMVLVSAKAKREQAVGQFFDALTAVLEDIRPIVKPMVDELLREAAEDAETRVRARERRDRQAGDRPISAR